MNTEEILSALEHNHGVLPRAAIAQAVKEKDSITPRLIETIERATEKIEDIHDDTTYMLHIYALYLLAQFRETDAYLPIVAFFSTPGEMVMEATGDVVTEDLDRILASTYNGDPDPLKRLVEDDSVSEFVRSAALRTICSLWGHERLSREEVVDYYRTVLNTRILGDNPLMWSMAIAGSFKLSPDELKPDIDEAFEQGLIEDFYFSRDDFNGSMGLSNEEALRAFRRDRKNSLIENVIAELENWACFRTEKEKRLDRINPTSRSKRKKTGRNDPCICGSGLKYKKCCLRAV